MNQDNNKNNNDEQENFERILAKESPDLLLKLKEKETGPRFRPSLFSAPAKFVIFVGIVDIIVALFLTIIEKKSHFFILGSAGIGVLIPWPLAFLDGFIFIGYGIYVIKKKKGELDVSFSSRAAFEMREIKGEASCVLGLIYILLGILLIGAVVMECFIQGIF